MATIPERTPSQVLAHLAWRLVTTGLATADVIAARRIADDNLLDWDRAVDDALDRLAAQHEAQS